MKLTLTNVRELKRHSASPLTKAVCAYIVKRWNDYTQKEYIFKNVLYHGCQSGAVAELIYYSDTLKFYEQYRGEILALLYGYMQEIGIYSPAELFKTWDSEDNLAENAHNRSLLAWYGFEETMRNIALRFDNLCDCV